MTDDFDYQGFRKRHQTAVLKRYRNPTLLRSRVGSDARFRLRCFVGSASEFVDLASATREAVKSTFANAANDRCAKQSAGDDVEPINRRHHPWYGLVTHREKSADQKS
jgi:hypothetical protein